MAAIAATAQPFYKDIEEMTHYEVRAVGSGRAAR
jgi:hypothetical protein